MASNYLFCNDFLPSQIGPTICFHIWQHCNAEGGHSTLTKVLCWWSGKLKVISNKWNTLTVYYWFLHWHDMFLLHAGVSYILLMYIIHSPRLSNQCVLLSLSCLAVNCANFWSNLQLPKLIRPIYIWAKWGYYCQKGWKRGGEHLIVNKQKIFIVIVKQNLFLPIIIIIVPRSKAFN